MLFLEVISFCYLRVVNEIIHQYRFEFWPDTINRMKTRNIYREFWDIPTYIHYGSTQFDPKKNSRLGTTLGQNQEVDSGHLG